MMISSRPHLRFCSIPVVFRQTPRLQRRRLSAPRTRILATYQSEAADDFSEYVEEGDAGYEMANDDVMGRKKGVVKWFDNKKGFGFIAQDDGSGDIFVHQTNIQTSGYRSLREGEAVEFDAVYSEDGRLTALAVTGPEGREPLGSDRDAYFGQSYGRENSFSQSSGRGSNQGRFMSEPNTEVSAFSSGLQVVVHNIPWSVSEDRLREFFADYNTVECEIQYDELGRSRGYGTVRFGNTEDAKEAIMDLHGSQLDGRTVSVRFDRYA